MSSGAIIKPKSKAYKRFLENREPKLIENDKTCLFLRGGNSSAAVTKVMSTFHSMMKPNAVQFHQKNMLRPFEDPSSLEFFAERNDASLFCFGSHSKKRPHNIVFGRFHNNSLLDMVELCVNYCNIPNKLRIPTGIKPMLSFTGEGWTDNAELERVRNMFTDIFVGRAAENVSLKGLELLLNFEINPEMTKIKMNTYKVILKKSGTNVPRVEFEDIKHPDDLSIEFGIRRKLTGSSELWKKSMKRPASKGIGQVEKKSKKNQEMDGFGHMYGRVHMEKQDLSKLELQRSKALKKGGMPRVENDPVLDAKPEEPYTHSNFESEGALKQKKKNFKHLHV